MVMWNVMLMLIELNVVQLLGYMELDGTSEKE